MSVVVKYVYVVTVYICSIFSFVVGAFDTLFIDHSLGIFCMVVGYFGVLFAEYVYKTIESEKLRGQVEECFNGESIDEVEDI